MADERVIVRYRFPASAEGAAARALAIALEQSTELPAGFEPSAVRHLGLPGRVEALAEVAAAPGQWEATISLPAFLAGEARAAALINMLFGNTSMQPDVTLVDADLPPSIVQRFAGPRLGIAGVRAMLHKPTGPISCTALKPAGLSAAELGTLAGRFAYAGVDLIKEDHGITHQESAPLLKRLRVCQQAVNEANGATGGQSLYLPHLCGTLTEMQEVLDRCRTQGVRGILVAPMLVGLETFEVIALLAHGLGMVVLAHPALSGAVRIAPDFLLGRLFRLLGADGVIFVNHGGRFGTPPATCRALANNLRQPWGHLHPALPIPAGGMTTARVPEMIDFYGDEVALLISGALYPADEQLETRAAAFVSAAGSQSRA